MSRNTRLLLIAAGVVTSFLFSGPASANTATVKCVTKQGQISVYDSVTTLRVAMKLKCGEDVEVIERLKDYVKIRAQNGVEGYVTETSLPAMSAAVAATPRAANTLAKPGAESGTPAVDPNDLPVFQPENESADPACQNYFSAYGLTPSQLKWIAQNRKKQFSNVCPAAQPGKVNFVIIFTHDVDFFGATMPKPVHMIGGISDFTALTPIDTVQMSASEADKAHRQYVWVFQFAQGSFDPASFSPHRRCQYWKVESSPLGTKAGQKTVEDAFRFVATANH